MPVSNQYMINNINRLVEVPLLISFLINTSMSCVLLFIQIYVPMRHNFLKVTFFCQTLYKYRSLTHHAFYAQSKNTTRPHLMYQFQMLTLTKHLMNIRVDRILTQHSLGYFRKVTANYYAACHMCCCP